MRTIIILIFATVITFSSSAIAQCTPGGVKIQTPACEGPTNLKVIFLNCSQASLEWKGQKNQNYLVDIMGPDSTNKKVIELKATDNPCDNSGNCSTKIPVVEGAEFYWDVQANCLLDSVNLYSFISELQKVLVPICNNIDSIRDNKVDAGVKIYPNPSSGFLNVYYKQQQTGPLSFTIYNIEGKILLERSAVASEAGLYQFDLHTLASGTYMININGSGSPVHARFILLRN